MARLARFVLSGIPHHVTQRGNGRQQTFFCDADYAAYRDLLKTHCAANGVAVWSWVLMPNHVHLILVPEHGVALRAALSKVHRAYAGRIHSREKRTGHFWQGRFGCVAMDEPHLLAALRYVALNPVRARLSARAQDWRWSSVHACLDPQRSDGLTETAPVLERVPDFAALLRSSEDEARSTQLRKAESTGRPLGDSAFLERVAALLGRDPKPGKRGPRAGEKGEISALSP
ncbi:transposase [Novosphingobium sp.]|uniref:transposase n=1 Tax=Novosphingobium sp. TaxID=1874826 RepID=UPI00286AF98F|nr:transposase [Novosphingobium sp.]